MKLAWINCNLQCFTGLDMFINYCSRFRTKSASLSFLIGIQIRLIPRPPLRRAALPRLLNPASKPAKHCFPPRLCPPHAATPPPPENAAKTPQKTTTPGRGFTGYGLVTVQIASCGSIVGGRTHYLNHRTPISNPQPPPVTARSPASSDVLLRAANGDW